MDMPYIVFCISNMYLREITYRCWVWKDFFFQFEWVFLLCVCVCVLIELHIQVAL